MFLYFLRFNNFHFEFVRLKAVLKSKSYSENFINNCFQTFLDNKHRIQEKVITVPKKPLILVAP